MSKEDILKLVKEHLASEGIQTGEISIVIKDKEEYEYYGIGRHEERTKVKCKYFDGIEAVITHK